MIEAGLVDMQLAEIVPAIEVFILCFSAFLIAGLVIIKVRNASNREK
tara:strand:- start:265 stop:405 length:141 start_codon:yes stop_codon:yes gene_type:complete